jgi:hypothetical protein
MSNAPGRLCLDSIQGQFLRLSARREVAIYLREGRLWVADFIDGEGQLIEPCTWFRFNCAAPRASLGRRRMTLEAATPLTPEIAARIEDLHTGLDRKSEGRG